MKNRRTKMKRLTGIITAICMVIIFSGVSIFGVRHRHSMEMAAAWK